MTQNSFNFCAFLFITMRILNPQHFGQSKKFTYSWQCNGESFDKLSQFIEFSSKRIISVVERWYHILCFCLCMLINYYKELLLDLNALVKVKKSHTHGYVMVIFLTNFHNFLVFSVRKWVSMVRRRYFCVFVSVCYSLLWGITSRSWLLNNCDKFSKYLNAFLVGLLDSWFRLFPKESKHHWNFHYEGSY